MTFAVVCWSSIAREQRFERPGIAALPCVQALLDDPHAHLLSD